MDILTKNPLARTASWALIALGGAGALATIALHRGETVNALWVVVAFAANRSNYHAQENQNVRPLL